MLLPSVRYVFFFKVNMAMYAVQCYKQLSSCLTPKPSTKGRCTPCPPVSLCGQHACEILLMLITELMADTDFTGDFVCEDRG